MHEEVKEQQSNHSNQQSFQFDFTNKSPDKSKQKHSRDPSTREQSSRGVIKIKPKKDYDFSDYKNIQQ